MSKFVLSKAMGSIPDEMLQEAMTIKKNTGRKWIIRAAACLVLVIGLLFATMREDNGIVTAPGILTVTVYAADETPFTITSPDTVLHESIYWDGPSSYTVGCPITLEVPDEYDCSDNVVFQIAIDGGGMLLEVKNTDTFVPGNVYQYMPANFTTQNHSTIKWTTIHLNAEMDEYSMQHRNTAHVEIVIYDGDKIVGYSVLRFRRMTCSEVIDANPEWISASEHTECAGDHQTDCYRVEMLESVFFPKIEGEYQTIEEEYVCEQIAKVKQH